MTLFGYKVEYGRLSPKQQRDWDEYAYACTYFGVGSWTFNNPKYYSRDPKVAYVREKRILTHREKGFYTHLWLFGYRFDLNFRKTVPV